MIDIYYCENGVKKADAKQLKKLKNKLLWIDINSITKQEGELIRDVFNLHPLTIEDIMQANSRVKVEDFPDYLFCVFYGIQKTKAFELYEIDFIIGRNFLITNHKKPIPSFEALKSHTDKISVLCDKGMDFLFHKLLDVEVDNYFPVLENIDDQTEDIEEKVIKKASSEILAKILKLKRNIIAIKKVTLPQREKMGFLAKNQYAFISRKCVPYFRDIYDHAIRISDMIDNYREAAANTFDVYMSTVSNNMNDVMKILSIIATIALPLTVISGIYGTNFTNLPGQEYFYGFWVMIAAMAVLCVVMLFFFKRRKWF